MEGEKLFELRLKERISKILEGAVILYNCLYDFRGS